MKLLKRGTTPKTPDWEHETHCGDGLQHGQVGCGAELELNIFDVYKQEFNNGMQIRVGYYFMCPCCHVENLVSYNELPKEFEYPTKGKWLRLKRDSLVKDIFDVLETPESAQQFKIELLEDGISADYLRAMGLID